MNLGNQISLFTFEDRNKIYSRIPRKKEQKFILPYNEVRRVVDLNVCLAIYLTLKL